MIAPRSFVQALAARLDVSEAQAKAIIRQHGGLTDEATAMDAELKTHAALADLDAAQSIDQIDIDDATTDPDPLGSLNSTLMTRSERSLRARLAAQTRWANEDPAEQGRKMRAGFDERFAKQIDSQFPDLNPAERARRIESARKAYFTRLALKSAQARRKKRQ